MKVITLIIAMFLSTMASAGQSDAGAVINAMHALGFYGCEKSVEADYENHSIGHFEIKLPFAVAENGQDRLSKAVTDEVILVEDWVGRSEYDWQGGVSSSIYRVVNKKCLSAMNISVSSSIKRNCSEFAKFKMSDYKIVANTPESTWVQYPGAPFEKEGSRNIYTTLNGGGCREISLPESHNGLVAK